MQVARNVGTGDATFDSAAQEHNNTSGSASSSLLMFYIVYTYQHAQRIK